VNRVFRVALSTGYGLKSQNQFASRGIVLL